MDTVPHAHTHARTNLVENNLRGGGRDYQSYPNRRGKPRDDDNRGALRVGIVEENEATEAAGLAGYLAAVTHEEHGEVRFYIGRLTPSDSQFPNVWLWVGPYWALSEEIVPME